MILHELVATTSGAFAAIFLDFEGETVELVCDRDFSDHDLRIIGAYQGIFLNRLREMCVRLAIGNASAQRVLDPIENVFGKLLGVIEQLFHLPFEVR